MIAENVQENREPKISPTIIIDIGVEFRSPANFADEEREAIQRQPGKDSQAVLNLQADLVLEESRVLLQFMIEKITIRECRGYEVYSGDTEYGEHGDGGDLARKVVSRPSGAVIGRDGQVGGGMRRRRENRRIGGIPEWKWKGG